MSPPSIWRLKEAGYKVHEDGRPNVIAFRSPSTTPDAFDDWIGIWRKVDGSWQSDLWTCTTDPGLAWMQSDKRNPDGAARLAPGQWRFKVGRRSPSKGGYECLVQAAEVTVIRDDDGDAVIDGDKRFTGWFGIQVHRASAKGGSTVVGLWSAGCVVLPLSQPEFEEFMDEVKAGLVEEDEDVLVTVLEDPKVRA